MSVYVLSDCAALAIDVSRAVSYPYIPKCGFLMGRYKLFKNKQIV